MLTIDSFFIAEIRGLGCLYWPYARETLCGRSKVHKPSYSWFDWEGGFCPECCSLFVEIVVAEGLKERVA